MSDEEVPRSGDGAGEQMSFLLAAVSKMTSLSTYVVSRDPVITFATTQSVFPHSVAWRGADWALCILGVDLDAQPIFQDRNELRGTKVKAEGRGGNDWLSSVTLRASQ